MRVEEARRLVQNYPNDLYKETLTEVFDLIRERAIDGKCTLSWQFIDLNIAHFVITNLRSSDYLVNKFEYTETCPNCPGHKIPMIRIDISWREPSDDYDYSEFN